MLVEFIRDRYNCKPTIRSLKYEPSKDDRFHVIYLLVTCSDSAERATNQSAVSLFEFLNKRRILNKRPFIWTPLCLSCQKNFQSDRIYHLRLPPDPVVFQRYHQPLKDRE